MALPSSDVNSSITCHGLRPRHAAYMLAFSACSSTGFQVMNPLAQCDIFNFGAQYLHLRYGRLPAIPLASHNSLPPYTQSSVLAWWLTFGQAGLSSLLPSASLGALIFASILQGFGDLSVTSLQYYTIPNARYHLYLQILTTYSDSTNVAGKVGAHGTFYAERTRLAGGHHGGFLPVPTAG